MKTKVSIHYFLAHMIIRNLVFEDYIKFKQLLSEGPDSIKTYFYMLWIKQKQEFQNRYDLDVIDIDREINKDDFVVSYSLLENEQKVFNFTMPKPLNEQGQAMYISVVITSKIPRYFTLELSRHFNGEECYVVGEWKIDFENNDYKHINYGTMDESVIGKFLGKINEIVNLEDKCY